MANTIMDGGVHISIELRLDAKQIAAMPVPVVSALMHGIADIVTAKHYVAASVPPAASDPSQGASNG